MVKITNITWSFLTNELPWASLTFFDPEPAYPEIVKNRDLVKNNSSNFLLCPAVREYFKNTYVIKSPVDIDLIFDSSKNWIQVTNQHQQFYDTAIVNRCSVRKSENNPMIMSLNFQYLFVSDKKCLIESLQPSMHLNKCIENIRIIPGTFDISSWFRPIDPTFEVVDHTKKLTIKRGDPLLYVRFVTDDKVQLTYKEYTEKMGSEIDKCLTVKTVLKNLSLQKLYELTKRVNKNVFKN